MSGKLCAHALAMLAVCVVSSASYAAPIPVGSGDDHAAVVVNFGDGAAYEFDVAFSDPNTTGFNLLDSMESAGIGFSTVRLYDGAFVDAISFDGHSDAGAWTPETPDNWWHYWVRYSPQGPWVLDFDVSAARTIADGYGDGWVYGSSNPPAIPEPASVLLMGLAAGWLLRRRGRRNK